MIKWLVRIGCAVGILVIVAVAGLVLLGGGRHSAHSETAVTINHPAARIWPWLVEPPRLRKWLGGYVDSVPEPGQPTGQPPGLRVGARRTEQVELDGRRWDIKSQVTALSPPHELSLHMSAPEFEDDTTYTLEEHGNITIVRYRNDAHYTMFLARLMSPIICHDVEHKMQTDLAKLRELLDQEPQNVIAPPQPGNRPAFSGCCAPEPQ